MSLRRRDSVGVSPCPAPPIGALKKASVWEALLTRPQEKRRSSPYLRPLLCLNVTSPGSPFVVKLSDLPYLGTVGLGRAVVGVRLHIYVRQKTTSNAFLPGVRQSLIGLELCQAAHELPGRRPSPLPPVLQGQYYKCTHHSQLLYEPENPNSGLHAFKGYYSSIAVIKYHNQKQLPQEFIWVCSSTGLDVHPSEKAW